MQFILPYAPDAARVSYVDPKTGSSVRVTLPCSDVERAAVEGALGVHMVPAPARPKAKDGDE